MLVLGGWLLTIFAVNSIPEEFAAMHSYRLITTALAAVMMVVGWVVPLIRHMREHMNQASPRALALELGERLLPAPLRREIVCYSRLIVLATPFLFYGYTAAQL